MPLWLYKLLHKNKFPEYCSVCGAKLEMHSRSGKWNTQTGENIKKYYLLACPNDLYDLHDSYSITL